MEEGRTLGRKLTESEINRINLMQEGYTLSPLEQILFALVEANKRGEHVWYKWWNNNIGDNGILNSEGLETIDDAYIKYMGYTYQEAIEKNKAMHRKWEEDEQKEQQYIADHKEELLNAGKLLLSDAEKVAEWENRVLAAVTNKAPIAFYLLMQAAEVIKAIQEDSTLNAGLALLSKYEPATSGAAYNMLKSIIFEFSPDLGVELYSLYENKKESTRKK